MSRRRHEHTAGWQGMARPDNALRAAGTRCCARLRAPRVVHDVHRQPRSVRLWVRPDVSTTSVGDLPPPAGAQPRARAAQHAFLAISVSSSRFWHLSAIFACPNASHCRRSGCPCSGEREGRAGRRDRGAREAAGRRAGRGAGRRAQGGARRELLNEAHSRVGALRPRLADGHAEVLPDDEHHLELLAGRRDGAGPAAGRRRGARRREAA